MAELRIDLATFKRQCKAVRNGYDLDDFIEEGGRGYRATRKVYYDHSDFNPAYFRPAVIMTAEQKEDELHRALNVAARAAYTNGATYRQIDMIVHLSVELNDFNILSGGYLTKAAASDIIDLMKRDLARKEA